LIVTETKHHVYKLTSSQPIQLVHRNGNNI